MVNPFHKKRLFFAEWPIFCSFALLFLFTNTRYVTPLQTVLHS